MALNSTVSGCNLTLSCDADCHVDSARGESSRGISGVQPPDIGTSLLRFPGVSLDLLFVTNTHSDSRYCKVQTNASSGSNSVGFEDIVPVSSSTAHVAAAAFYHCLGMWTVLDLCTTLIPSTRSSCHEGSHPCRPTGSLCSCSHRHQIGLGLLCACSRSDSAISILMLYFGRLDSFILLLAYFPPPATDLQNVCLYCDEGATTFGIIQRSTENDQDIASGSRLRWFCEFANAQVLSATRTVLDVNHSLCFL